VRKQKLFDPKFKGAYRVQNDIDRFKYAEESRGEFNKRIIKEPLHQSLQGFDFPRNHKFFENFDKKLKQLFEAGIIQHYRESLTELANPKRYEKPIKIHKEYLETTWKKNFVDGPKVLTWNDLEFGFKLWLWSLLIPIIVFIFEWIKFSLRLCFKAKELITVEVQKIENAKAVVKADPDENDEINRLHELLKMPLETRVKKICDESKRTPHAGTIKTDEPKVTPYAEPNIVKTGEIKVCWI
jgi:hypothetical protein